MPETSRIASAPAAVDAVLNYIDPACDGGILYEMQRESSTLVFDRRPTLIRNARTAGRDFSLDANGFQLVRHLTDVDLCDLDQVQTRHAPEIDALVRGLTGASEVFVFNHIIRDEGDPDRNKPAHSVHVDFDEATLRGFIAALHPDPERVQVKRFALINLWRGITPVERAPLAVCDASTIAPGDLRVGHIKMKPGEDSAPMSGFNVAHNPAHSWWYYPHMRPDELLVFKLFDSDPARIQLGAHTAFDDPSSPADAKPRRSLEVRTLAFFD